MKIVGKNCFNGLCIALPIAMYVPIAHTLSDSLRAAFQLTEFQVTDNNVKSFFIEMQIFSSLVEFPLSFLPPHGKTSFACVYIFIDWSKNVFFGLSIE